MKLDDAIAAHVGWKLRLRQFADGQGEKLESAIVRLDDRCPLGQWLHGEGKTLAAHAEFKTVVASHAAFHRCAADVVRAVEGGSRAKAETLLAPAGAFDKASQETVSALVRLKRVVKSG